MLGTCLFMLETTSITASKQIHFILDYITPKYFISLIFIILLMQALMCFGIAHLHDNLKAHTYVWSIDILHIRIDIDLVHNV